MQIKFQYLINLQQKKDWNKVYEKLGRPKSADEYKFNLPEDKTVDEAALKTFAEQAHKLGLLPGQADGVVKFYNDMIGAELAEANSIAEAARNKATTELKTEWGQAYDQKIAAANQCSCICISSRIYEYEYGRWN